MSRDLRTAAERLLGFETAAGRRAAETVAAARVCNGLRRVLARLLGTGGFRALLVRAVTLAKTDTPDLGPVQVAADGSLEGLSELEPANGARFADGEVALVARLLGLLVTFIGEAMMLRVVQDAWPKASFDDLTFEKETA